MPAVIAPQALLAALLISDQAAATTICTRSAAPFAMPMIPSHRSPPKSPDVIPDLLPVAMYRSHDRGDHAVDRHTIAAVMIPSMTGQTAATLS